MGISESCLLSVRVQPGARREGVVREGEGWKIVVRAPPVEGQANVRVCEFLAKEVLGLSRRAVRVKSGELSRNKVLEIDASLSWVEERLAAFGGQDAG